MHADLELFDFCTGAKGGPHGLKKLVNSAALPSFVAIPVMLAWESPGEQSRGSQEPVAGGGMGENEAGKEGKLLPGCVTKLVTAVGNWGKTARIFQEAAEYT